MCTYNIKIDDAVMERAKPHFKGADAMQLWIERQLQKMLMDYVWHIEHNKNKAIEKKELLRRLEAVKDDSDGLFKLGGILGKPNDNFSWEQLRDEAPVQVLTPQQYLDLSVNT